MFHPQGNFYSQGIGFPQGLGYQGFPGTIPFANTLHGYPQLAPLYGYPQPTPGFAHGLAQLSQPFTAQPLQGTNGFALNGAAQSTSAWQQPQVNPEQINAAWLQQSQQQLLQRLAQYHYQVAQQLMQMAAQQATQGPVTPYAGQFTPSQLGANFVPGFTMH